MADEPLLERLANGVFDPPVAFADLADYHLDFDQLANASPEADVRERAERQSGCCAVVGPSGAGKSSVIAAVAASLSRQRFPVRIQGVNDPSVLTREGFALHVGRETLRALQAIELDRPSRRELVGPQTNLASSRGRTSGGHGVAAALPVGFTAEVKTSPGKSSRSAIPPRSHRPSTSSSPSPSVTEDACFCSSRTATCSRLTGHWRLTGHCPTRACPSLSKVA